MLIRSCVRIAFVLSLLAAAGCSSEIKEGEVSGSVTVDGQMPSVGSSITFIPTDGTSPTAGAVIENGKYMARVPVGKAKVEIRVPRPVQNSAAPKAGPGSEGPGGGGGFIEESLPAKYNDATELTIDVQSGKNPKDWTLSTTN